MSYRARLTRYAVRLTLGIRGRLFSISLGLILLAAVTSGVLVETVMRSLLVDRVRDELTRVAELSAESISVSDQATPTTHAALVRRLGTVAAARVTLISVDGRVIADSSLSEEEVARADNHLHRPEVESALRQGHGAATRHSDTINSDMMYVAVPFEDDAQRGVMRVAMSLAEVDALIAHMRWLITGAVLMGLAIAAGMGALASYLASRSLLQLVTRARALASGARGERLSMPDSEELGGLAGSFNRMADELDRTLSTLGDERDRVQAILESLTDAVLALDAGATISEMNRAALSLLGLPRAPTGSPLIEVIRVPALLDAVASAQRGATSQIEFVWPGPPRRILLATAAPQRASGRCVVVLRDVTELRGLETMRRDFVANVSHELRTPVSIISANVETLLGGALADPQRAEEFLGAVQRNAERLARLVNELLDLARIEAGEGPELTAMTAEGAVGAVLDLLETRAHGRRLALEIAVEDDLTFIGEARSLEQVLVNLVDNAIKYTPEGGSVGVEVRSDGDDALFEVWDTGPGVPELHRARLFERFYRVDPGRSRDMGGTGLGLSIVKHLVEGMRGTVGMRPRAPRGSVFWVRLRRVDGGPRGRDEHERDARDASPSSERPPSDVG